MGKQKDREWELITPCGEVVAGRNPRLKRSRKSYWKIRDNDIYVTAGGELAFRIYEPELKRNRVHIYTPQTEKEREMIRQIDVYLKEEEKGMRRNVAHKSRMKIVDDGACERNKNGKQIGVCIEASNSPKELENWPEVAMLRMVLGDAEAECYQMIFEELCSQRMTQKEAAEKAGVKPAAIGNKYKRLKDTARKGFEEFGITEDTILDYPAQTNLLKERLKAMMEESNLIEKHRKLQKMEAVLEKRVGAFRIAIAEREALGNDRNSEELSNAEYESEQMLIAALEGLDSVTKAEKDLFMSLSDERYGTVLLLRDINGLKWKDVADEMGLSIRGAQKLYKRATEELEGKL